MIERITEHHHVIAELQKGGHGVEWRAYALLGPDEPLLYLTDGETTMGGTTRNIHLAEPCAMGTVQFNGCHDFDLSPVDADSYRHHTCNPAGLAAIIAPAQIGYELAAELMPEHARGWPDWPPVAQ